MNIFIHYLDKELLDIYSGQRISESLVDKVAMSIKIAILLTKEDEFVYVPVSSYFESELGKLVLEKFRNIMDLGIINLVSSSKSLNSFISKKKIVYPSVYSKEDIKMAEEQLLESNVPGIWTPRNRSATEDIVEKWKENIDSTFWEPVYRISKYKKISSFENAISSIPQKLNNKAFVVSHVIPELNIDFEMQMKAKELINEEITKYYIQSFLQEYNAVCYKNFFLLGSYTNSILPIGYNHVDYGGVCRKLAGLNYQQESLYSYISNADNYQLFRLREKKIITELSDNFRIYIKGEKKMKIFIVHGHDGEAKLSLKNYIQNTLKLGEPIILSEKSSGGLTIIEKFEKYSEECNLVFVLLTPDDKYTDNGTVRARQNVIFEMSYFLGKLGRKSGRIILLYKGILELPNDISGVVYINIDNGIEAAGEEIRREVEDL